MPLQFLPQCCDANLYLDIGAQCAATNDCYHALRPMGANLWFSLPFRLGLPADSLMALHAALLALSVWLSVNALRTLLPGSLSMPQRSGLWLASSIAHAVFFLPVTFYALSDAPAALFVLIACWLLLWQRAAATPRSIILQMTTAGLLLGLAAWVRTFYLAPLALMLPYWLFMLRHRARRTAIAGLILAALLPVCVQYATTYSRFGALSFMAPAATQSMYLDHFWEPAGGYDTLASNKPLYWHATCDGNVPVYKAFFARSFSEHACIFNNRLHFYLGSYGAATYLLDDETLRIQHAQQHFLPQLLESFGATRHWSPFWFLLNAIALITAAQLLYRHWQRIHPTGRSATCFALLCFLEAFPLSPEQRFLIVPMTMAWLLAATHVIAPHHNKQPSDQQ